METIKNTYSKYVPNVFLAKCPVQYEKGETILVSTKYGRDNECIVFNLIYSKDGFYYYSIVRADGFNAQEYAKKRAERFEQIALNRESKSDERWKASNEGREFLALGEPIKVGHHSERRHRALIQRNHNRMSAAVQLSKEAEEYKNKADYWKKKENIINLSMPECIDYYLYKLEEAKELHEGLKNGSIEKRHSYSLVYAKKEVNELQKKLNLAIKLWE